MMGQARIVEGISKTGCSHFALCNTDITGGGVCCCRYGRDNVFRQMADVQVVAAMGPPGGGRTFITNRYLRHFNLLAAAQVRSGSFLMVVTLQRSGGGPQLAGSVCAA
jgi:hypothetical protein